MSQNTTRPIRLLLVLALMLLAIPTAAQHERTADEIMQAKEAALEEGVLPAWETTAERAAARLLPRVDWIDDGPLPPPPDSPYRAPGEFEQVAAFVVTFSGWGGDSGMMYDMVREGTQDGGAGAIVLTGGSVSAAEDALEAQGIDLDRVRVLSPTEGLDAKWARDFGPMSIYEDGEDGRLGIVDMHYYDSRPHDDAVPEFLADEMGLERYGIEGTHQSPADEHRLYMEGGNYQTDGNGTCILSNDIPSDNNGNPDADTFAEVEQILAAYLGCEQIIWLEPMPNNSTGHVDMYSKLLGPTEMLMIDLPNQNGANGTADAVVEDNVLVMESATNLDDEPFTIHRVTIPPLGWGWVYKTYTNSVILNQVVLVPTYNEGSYDTDALAVYENAMGGEYTIVGIPSAGIVSQGGAVHCTTKEIASACGNGSTEDLLFEECDGDDLAGEDCESLGYDPGELFCDVGCRFDVSGCGGGSDSDSDSDVDSDVDGDTDADSDGDGAGASPGSSGCGCISAGAGSAGSLIGLALSALSA
jgi:agmatine/peptidylarginine deiminase